LINQYNITNEEEIDMSSFSVRTRKKIFPAMLFLVIVPLLHGFAHASQASPTLKDVISGAEQTDDSQSSVSNGDAQKRKLVKVGPDDEFDRGVPRNTVAGYFQALRDEDLVQAAQYLDLRNLPRGYRKSDGPELAQQLKVVLDRSLWVEMDLLSTDPKGHSDDGLPAYRDLVGQIEVRAKKYHILLQRVPRKDGINIWQFSSKTVREIPELYDALGYGPLGEKLSEYFPEYELLGLQLWQWIFLILIALAAALVLLPFVRLTSWLIQYRRTELSLMSARFINGPLYVVLILVLTRNYFDLISPSLAARAISEGSTLLIIASIWLLIRLVDLFREYYERKLIQREQESAIVLLGPASTTLKMLILFLGLLTWLDNIGFSVTTVLAGLGIGGIAIALATQKSIENFIGALTLYLAAPVKVGDFCRFSDKMGKVEEIGLRATKIRTLEDTVVTVPNAEFANMQIENLSERRRYRFNPSIRLYFATSSEQLRYIRYELQKLLYAHNRVAESPVGVRFTGFGEHSLDLEIHCYIDTTDINEFKSVSEDLNLRIMDIIQSAGTSIAIPSSNEVKASPNELSAELKQQARQQVEKFINSSDATTELNQQQIDEIKNTIKYPAE